MRFPTTSVLDAGTSPVENPIATNWDGPIFAGQQPLQRTATGIARGSAAGGSWYDVQQFGPDMECYATIAVLTDNTNTGEGFLYVRMQNPNTTSLDGYVIRVRRAGAGADDVRMYVETDGVDSQLGSTYTVGEIVPGTDQYGISAVGDQITGYYNNGGGWSVIIGPVTDATYPSAGYVGIEMVRSDTRLTDFGGGAYVPEILHNFAHHPKVELMGLPT